MIPTMFVPSNLQENTYYPESNQGVPPQLDTTGTNDPYNMSYTPEFAPQGQISSPGNYSYGAEVVPSSVGYQDTTPSSHDSSETRFVGASSDGGRSLDFYEGDSFEHLLQKQPNGNSVDQVESSGISTSTSDNSFDYYGQSKFRVRLLLNMKIHRYRADLKVLQCIVSKFP